MQVTAPDKEIMDIIKEEGGEIAELCYQCGTCTAVCPWNRVRSFPVRELMHRAQLGLIDFENDDMFRCLFCETCIARCPRKVKILEVMRAFRRVIVEVGAGKIPDSLRLATKNISAVGNPLGEPPEKRPDWTKDLDVKTFTKGTEFLYYPCCYQCYDPIHQKVAQDTVNILNKAGVEFGVLGAELSCCGESVRKSGNESLWRSLAQKNIEVFKGASVKKILVSSPHCYTTFKEEYPELGGDFEVVHVVQYYVELIKNGRLKLNKEVNKKVTYHDPCCWGRHWGAYDEPRQVLQNIPGIELAEMRENRENALCCGGSCAGRVWIETKKGERLSDLRLDQAIETGASVLAVSCPYCKLNFDDTVLTLGKDEVIQVKDVSELLQEAL
jgi:Fe-S oxidoreductase